MKYDKKTLKEVLDLNKVTKLVLPNFQRNFVWKADIQQRTLLASFILELPIGSILTLEGTSNDFAARDLCTPQAVEPSQDCLYLLDGQQRVSTLKSMFFDLFSGENWKKDWDNMFKDLRNRWFVSVESSDEIDFFGIETLDFKSSTFKTIEPEQFGDNVVLKKLLVNNSSQWFHPGFIPKNDLGQAIDNLGKRKLVATASADESIVPLYELYGFENGTPLHKLALDRIATKKAHDLKLKYEGNDEGAIKLLLHAEQDIREFYGDEDKEKISLAWSKLAISWSTKVSTFLESIVEYELSQIDLPSDEIARAFAIFEVINQPGTPLEIYDLIAAKAARNRELTALSSRIKAIIDEELSDINAPTNRVLGTKPNTVKFDSFGLISEDTTPAKTIRNQYLNLLSIFDNIKNGQVDDIKVDFIKRQKILQVTTDRINELTPKVIKALKRASAFLHIRCGIEKISSLNYELMLLPIAYAVANDEFWNSIEALDKIEYWYWSSLFGGSYRENQNGRCIDDIKSLNKWLHGGDNPFIQRSEEILNAPGYSDLKVLALEDIDNSVPTAIHHGMLQYTLSKQPHDFIKSDPEIRLTTWDILSQKIFEINNKSYKLSVQDHHIYPLASSTSLFESSQKIRADKTHPLNSPLNRTYISSAANGLIRDSATDKYFPAVSQHAQHEHSLPLNLATVYIRNNDEDDKAYYKRLLESRYHLFLHDIKIELMSLVN